jgi:hypothetical protein
MATMVDEYWGQGGTYLQDPKTGKRTLIERTEPAQPSEPEPEELSNGSHEEAPPTGEN